MNFLSGFKTVLAGLALAAGPAALSYIGNVDVAKTFGLSPTAGMVVGAIMIGLRAITKLLDLHARQAVSFDLKGAAVTFLTATLGALGAGAASPEARVATLSASHFGALGTLLGLLPVADLAAIATGHATWDNVLDAAAHGADIVRIAFPPAAMTAEEVKLALEALRFVLDAAGIGPTPFHIEPGQNPIRGGWSGARGHV